MKYNLLLLTLLSLSLVACKSRQAAGSGLKLKNRSAEFVQKALVQNQFSAEWLSLKTKIKFVDADRNMTVSSNIRMRKDSLIWINAKAFGIEAGRVLIRPDSIFVLDRINKTYMAKDIFWLQDAFGLPVDFKGLQAILFGNPVFLHTDLQVGKDTLHYTLSGESARYKADYKADGATFKLKEMHLEQVQEKRSAEVQLSDYKAVKNKQLFSFLRNTIMKSPETGTATARIEIMEAEVDTPFDMPFEVTDRYKKIN